MAFQFDAGTSSHAVVYERTTEIETSDLTVCAWFNSNDVTQVQTIVRKATDDYLMAIVTSDLYVEAETIATQGGTLTNNTWHHGVMIFDTSATSAEVEGFLDGVSVGTADHGGSITYGTDASDDLHIGFHPAPSQHFDGEVCEIAYWNRVLSDAEITALANGYSPLFYPNGLRLYAPWVRETTEVARGHTYTIENGGPPVVVHPRIFYPTQVLAPSQSAAAAAAITTPEIMAAVQEYDDPTYVIEHPVAV